MSRPSSHPPGGHTATGRDAVRREVSLGDAGPTLWRRIFLVRHVAMVLLALVVPWFMAATGARVAMPAFMLLAVLPYSYGLYRWTLRTGHPPVLMAFADMLLLGLLTWFFSALWTVWAVSIVADVALLTLMFSRRVVVGAATFAVASLVAIAYVLPMVGDDDVAHVAYVPAADIIGVAVLSGILIPVLGALWEERRAYVARLRRLSRQLVQAQEDERNRLARELHDEIGQQLTGIKLRLANGAADPALASPTAREASAAVDALIRRVSDISRFLRPPALDELGLEEALARLVDDIARMASLDVRLEMEPMPRRLVPEIEIAVYRIVQEGLTNVVRHAESSRASVRLTASRLWVEMSIEDEGRGFAPPRDASGTGLMGMYERVTGLGGTFSILSGPGAGTRLRIRLPARAATGDGESEA